MDINKILTELLRENKRVKDGEIEGSKEYKEGYVDGVLDFYGVVKKEEGI